MNETVTRIFDYARDHYGVEPDYPFSNEPDIPVLRHRGTRKWFALLMNVSAGVLCMEGDRIDIINVKCDPVLSASLKTQKGFLPGYHMNHDQWLTILLDGSVPLEDILPLLDMSYELTMQKPKKRRRASE